MLIFTRGHYSIDIFGGFLFGHYLWLLAERFSYLIDYGLMRIPFHKRFPHFARQCGHCKSPINKWGTLMIELEAKRANMVYDEEILRKVDKMGQDQRGLLAK